MWSRQGNGDVGGRGRWASARGIVGGSSAPRAVLLKPDTTY